MGDKKIFNEIKGIFSWLEMQQNTAFDQNIKQPANEEERLKMNEERTYYQINEFFNFLKLDATHEDKEALNELVNPDRQLDRISFEKFYSVFIKSNEEQQRENEELKEAFKNLTSDKNDSKISIQRLRQVMDLYDKKYKNSMDKIIDDLSRNYAEDGVLDFDKYINEQFQSNN